MSDFTMKSFAFCFALVCLQLVIANSELTTHDEDNNDILDSSAPNSTKDDEPIKRGSNYLLSQRDPSSYGWGPQTHRALTTLSLAGALPLGQPQDLEQALMVKELQLRLALALAKQHQEALSTGQLALYVNALLSLCQNPRDFYGLNLVSKLLHSTEELLPYSYALVSVALCNSKVRFEKARYLKLIDVIRSNKSAHGIPDDLALTTLAMSCGLKNDPMYPLERYLNRAVKQLKNTQQEDGSFGNIYSSALVLQALLETGADDRGWNRSLAGDYILSQQSPDGAFNDFMGTYFALPLLANRTFASLANWTCGNGTSPVGELVTDPSVISNGSQDFKFTLYIRAPDIQEYHVNLTGQEKLNFYEISILNKEYISIEYQDTAYGHMIVGVDGLNQDPLKKLYWMIYTTDSTGKETPAKTGVDKIYPVDGDRFVFVLQPFQ